MKTESLRYLVPIPTPIPTSTFAKRFFEKWMVILTLLGLRGCKDLGMLENGNSLLKFRKTSGIADKNEIIQIPKDRIIYPLVRFFYDWGDTEAEFLSNGVKSALKIIEPSELLFIDLGAHIGLVTLQTLRRVKEPIQAIAIEPQPRHVEALTHNCSKYIEKRTLEIYPHGLGARSCEQQIFTDEKNSGSGSFIRQAAYVSVQEDNLLSVISSQDFEAEKLLQYKKFVIKSDIEGWDAEVLSNFSRTFWSKVEAAVVEIQPNSELDSLDFLVSEFLKFDFISWVPFKNMKLSKIEIIQFWRSDLPEVRNLYLHRNH